MNRRPTLPDQEARDFIEGRLDVNLLVEAGAGSGKTQSLARRMAVGIVEGVYEIEGMAAVTFTRKAAAELRSRFQIVLEEKYRAEQDDARKGRIGRALSRFERFFAGTIHAFCAHLIRERPVEAGVAPGFSELDEVSDQEFRNRSWRGYLDLQRGTESPTLQELGEAGVAPTDLEGAFRTVSQFPEVEFPEGEGRRPDPAPGWEELEAFWRRFRGLLPDQVSSETTCKVQKVALEFRGRLQVTDRSRPAALAELLSLWEKDRDFVQKWWGSTPQDRRATIAEVQGLLATFKEETVRPFLASWRQFVYRLAVTLLSEGRTFAEEARRRVPVLNYEDLLQVAARLLRENLEVRTALQQKYRWLFVDEFQDTDPIQAEVIFLLSAEPGAGREWDCVPLRPGVLFIVGDPKQSIYRFRRADINTYMRVKERILATGGHVAELSASFRSLPALCDWANRVFSSSFPERESPQQAAFSPLAPVHRDRDAGNTGIRILTLPATLRQGQVAEADAQSIARYIRSEVDAGRREWEDFLILTRKKRQLPVYSWALEELRIPLEVSGGAAFVTSGSLALLSGLLRTLTDPDDGVALVGVLRGPLFGLSDEELFRHRQAGYRFLLTAPLPADGGPVVEALRFLQEMSGWIRILPSPAAVERILEDTGLLALASTKTPGGAEAGHLLHAVDRVRSIAEAGGTLGDAARALEEELEHVEVESVSLEPGRRDVVRLMNLHKVKGLEAPVVFLADPLGGVAERIDHRIVRDGSRASGYFQIQRQVGQWNWELVAEPAGWPDFEAEELEYQRAEETRLLYVAATRARELMVISRWEKAGGNSARPWLPFESHLNDAPELEIPTSVDLLPVELPDLSEASRERAGTGFREKKEVTVQPSWSVATVTGTFQRGSPSRSHGEDRAVTEPETGMAWGNLIHALLEQAMRDPRRDRDHLHRFADFLTLDNPKLRQAIPDALNTVERVMASDFWQRAMTAEERLVEVPLAIRIIPEGAPPKILYGVIDLALRFPEGWEIIDYKTDQLGTDALADRYGDQVREYARHWTSLSDTPVSFAGLYAVRENRLTPNLL